MYCFFFFLNLFPGALRYLFGYSVGGPQRHGQDFTVGTDIVTVMQDAVFSLKHHCWSTMRKVLAVCMSKRKTDKQMK